MSIIAKNITKLYGSQKALDDVSFEIKPGEVVGLLGPNGAGKSTMMKIITCYLPPSDGEVSVSGFDVMENPMEVKKKVGYLPENNPLYLDMYIREYLLYIAGLYKIGKDSKKIIEETIVSTGLTKEQHKKIGALSKGFRQRVGLAQTLLHDPEVLILDEPTSGLDPNQLLEIRNLIKEIGKEKTIVLSTHIMQEVEAICDRAIIIHEGKIVADDATHKLSAKASNQNIITVEFSGDIDEKELKKLKGLVELNNKGNKTWEVISDSATDLRSAIFQFAVDNNLQVLSQSKQSRSLEEIFQTLTK
ncbi:gliding motility-associated ABC transporter ATP-binding subunit GldA [Bacteroidota bacterium]